MKQTGAQKEAKRLYKLFYDAANYDTDLSVEDIKSIAKNCSLVAADEMKGRALVWADPSEHDTIKDYFKQLRDAIKSL